MQQYLERMVRRYPWVRWPLILGLVGLLVLFGRVDRQLSGPEQSLNGMARVIDGDSLRVDRGEVRLKGIDAPEGRQTCRRQGQEWACGEDARRMLERLIGGQQVTCRSIERDKHDRLLGTCEAGGRSLNEAMVESGFAVSYGDYRDKERLAKSARRGLWGSEFDMPRAWRQQRGIGQ